MNKQVNQLLQKEMTRQEFLTTIGFGVASLLGLSSILKLLNGGVSGHRYGHGYGSSSYGE
jgi:hypothetical protein